MGYGLVWLCGNVEDSERINAMSKKESPRDALVRRTWGNVPVVDAKRELRVMILPVDVEKATRKDPGCCVFAQACIRSFGATKVLFYRTVAYVELPKEDGTSQVERFVMPKAMRDLIANFDMGKEVIPKAGFVLRPPAKSDSIDTEREKSRLYRENNKRKKLLGEATGHGGTRRNPSPVLHVMEVRNGTGAVHFT